MIAVPTRVEWRDHGVTITSDYHRDEDEARDWVRQQDHLGPGAIDEGRAWLVPAWDEDEERAR